MSLFFEIFGSQKIIKIRMIKSIHFTVRYIFNFPFALLQPSLKIYSVFIVKFVAINYTKIFNSKKIRKFEPKNAIMFH